MPPDGKSTNVLKYEYGRFEFDYQTEKMLDELVPRIFQSTFANHGKALARRTPDDYVDLPR